MDGGKVSTMTYNAQSIIISGPQIVAEDCIIKKAGLVIQQDKIQSIEKKENFSSEPLLVFPENYYLIPGFIDVHVHGADGFDVMDGTFEALDRMSQALAAEGTTSFLATTMTASSEKISRIVRNIGDYIHQPREIKGAEVLGIHLEGPFISPQKVGAQNVKDILAPQMNCLRDWQAASGNTIKLVTLAPELPNSLEFIRFLKAQHIVASIGHTDASYAETMAAVDAGCSHVTHLFNAMRGIHQREPGVVTAALLSEKLSTELILDGVHLHPAIAELVLKVKSKEKIILVTDAMRAKCLTDGVYDLGGQSVTVKNNKASLSDGTLAGSVLKMSSAIQNMMKFTRCDLVDAIRFATVNPAKLLNIFDQCGSIAPQKIADLVVLDDKLNVVMTMVAGQIVYQRK